MSDLDVDTTGFDLELANLTFDTEAVVFSYVSSAQSSLLAAQQNTLDLQRRLFHTIDSTDDPDAQDVYHALRLGASFSNSASVALCEALCNLPTTLYPVGDMNQVQQKFEQAQELEKLATRSFNLARQYFILCLRFQCGMADKHAQHLADYMTQDLSMSHLTTAHDIRYAMEMALVVGQSDQYYSRQGQQSTRSRQPWMPLRAQGWAGVADEENFEPAKIDVHVDNSSSPSSSSNVQPDDDESRLSNTLRQLPLLPGQGDGFLTESWLSQSSSDRSLATTSSSSSSTTTTSSSSTSLTTTSSSTSSTNNINVPHGLPDVAKNLQSFPLHPTTSTLKRPASPSSLPSTKKHKGPTPTLSTYTPQFSPAIDLSNLPNYRHPGSGTTLFPYEDHARALRGALMVYTLMGDVEVVWGDDC